MRVTCWCDNVHNRTCKCGRMLDFSGVHDLNCPQHPMHIDCRETLMREQRERLYRRKPSNVYAVQWTGDNIDEIKSLGADVFVDEAGVLMLRTGPDGVSGFVPVHVGEWAVRPVVMPEPHFWPVDNEHFANSYEREFRW